MFETFRFSLVGRMYNEKIENVQPFPNKCLVKRIEKLKRNFDLNKFITILLT